jgi:hypothetical protein
MILSVYEGADKTYALVQHSTQLPADREPWRLRGQIDLRHSHGSSFGVDVAQITDDIRRSGFHALSREEVLYLLAVAGVRQVPP